MSGKTQMISGLFTRKDYQLRIDSEELHFEIFKIL